VLVLAVAVAVLPTFIRARKPSSNSCINTLRQIYGATQQWGLENHKTPDDVPTWEDVRPYLSRGGSLPTCPKGGKYTLGRLDRPPTCSSPGHTVPWSWFRLPQL